MLCTSCLYVIGQAGPCFKVSKDHQPQVNYWGTLTSHLHSRQMFVLTKCNKKSLQHQRQTLTSWNKCHMDRWVSPLGGDELSHVGATRLHSGICGHTYSIQKAALLWEHVTKHEYHTGHGDGMLCHTWYICTRHKKKISRQSQRWNILLQFTHAVIIIWSFEIWCIILHKLQTINPK